jgi:hypothetical protein
VRDNRLLRDQSACTVGSASRGHAIRVQAKP